MIKILDTDKLHLFRKWAGIVPIFAVIPLFWRTPSEQIIVFMCLMSVYFYLCTLAPQKALDYMKLGAKLDKNQEAVAVLLSIIVTYVGMAIGFSMMPFASAIFLAPGLGAVWGSLSVVLILVALKIWEWA